MTLLNGEGGELQLWDGQRLILLLKSLGLAASVALGGTLLGALGGLYFHDKSSRLQRSIFLILLLLGTLPPYVHALSWNQLVDQLNARVAGIAYAGLSLRGWAAGWWVWTMALTPFSFSLITVGLKSINNGLIESARMLKKDVKILSGVILPLLKPYLALSAGLLFLISLTDYSIPSLFQTPSYAMSLFADFSAHNQPGRVFLLSLPLLVIGLVVLYSLQRLLRNTALNPVWYRKGLAAPYQWPAVLSWTQTLSAGMLILLALVPAYSLITLNSSLESVFQHIADAVPDSGNTLSTGILAAVCSAPFAYALARYIHDKRTRRFFPWLLISAPVIIPPTLTGIGLIAIWNHPLFSGIYNTWLMPVLAAIARYAPFAGLVFLAQLQIIKPELLEAAEILQGSSWRKWLWIKLPLTAPAWIAAMMIVFIFSLGELGATLLVVPAGSSTLTIRIYNYLHYGASETVASLTIMIALLALFAGVLVLLIFLSWNRYFGNQNQL